MSWSQGCADGANLSCAAWHMGPYCTTPARAPSFGFALLWCQFPRVLEGC
uniref:Uncharacterized protein n=1 Tax=Arundo donax TaxID=35708 RepID=A0A0A8ZSY5_ARUDO